MDNHRPANETPFRWRADDGPILNVGLVALWFFQGVRPSIAKKPYIFINDFSGRGGGVRTPCYPSGSAQSATEIWVLPGRQQTAVFRASRIFRTYFPCATHVHILTLYKSQIISECILYLVIYSITKPIQTSVIWQKNKKKSGRLKHNVLHSEHITRSFNMKLVSRALSTKYFALEFIVLNWILIFVRAQESKRIASVSEQNNRTKE